MSHPSLNIPNAGSWHDKSRETTPQPVKCIRTVYSINSRFVSTRQLTQQVVLVKRRFMPRSTNNHYGDSRSKTWLILTIHILTTRIESYIEFSLFNPLRLLDYWRDKLVYELADILDKQYYLFLCNYLRMRNNNPFSNDDKNSHSLILVDNEFHGYAPSYLFHAVNSFPCCCFVVAVSNRLQSDLSFLKVKL